MKLKIHSTDCGRVRLVVGGAPKFHKMDAFKQYTSNGYLIVKNLLGEEHIADLMTMAKKQRDYTPIFKSIFKNEADDTKGS